VTGDVSKNPGGTGPFKYTGLASGPLSKSRAIWFGLFIVTWILSVYGRQWSREFDLRWMTKYPSAWKLNLKEYISASMRWLVEKADLGLFTFTEFTRSIAWIIERPYEVALALLSDGYLLGQGSDAVQIIPPLSWLAVVVVIGAIGKYARSWTMAFFVSLAFGYLAVFGQWESAMVTLASILVAVPMGVLLGLLFGIATYRHPRLNLVVTPVLDLMQTMPIFAYLVPILFMFGFGPVAALIATIIYATPPMVRVTKLALDNVPTELVEFGRMAGCTERQLLWKVLVPAARNGIMVGVNQVIMLSLNMVIIASMIGAGGLGYDVLTSLRRLDIGAGLEAGLAIVVLAIALDRLSQAFAQKSRHAHPSRENDNLVKRYPHLAFALIVIALTLMAGYLLPVVREYPEQWQLTTGAIWEEGVRFINVNYFDQIEAFKTFLLTYFLLPIKRFLVGIPWVWGIVLLFLGGWYAGGWKLSLLCGFMGMFIAGNGLWHKAMFTVYLCGASVVIAAMIGVPLGIWAAVSDRANKVLSALIDTLQTLPSFVYLIPVVMLFRVGDFSAMIAVVLYAMAPAVRYTAHGIRSIEPQLIEAGIVSGCTKRQLLTRIRLPLAMPEIMLGINQTIMLALSMLVITAMVGTRDLGQEVYIALTKADTGRGIVAGLSVAFIAIVADRLIAANAARLRKRYGKG